jgi:exonuclease SbcC
VPELERIANEILSQMSNGEHNLRFETQRELKSKDGVAETLDIIVSDWHGSRPYETFSGGEASRCDLAIRIAISELLANRAGNKIEWLTMDETFSNQDYEHKELVIEAIKRVSGRFKKVIVITHDESLLGAFPQVINLSRNDAEVEVLAA